MDHPFNTSGRYFTNFIADLDQKVRAATAHDAANFVLLYFRCLGGLSLDFGRLTVIDEGLHFGSGVTTKGRTRKE